MENLGVKEYIEINRKCYDNLAEEYERRVFIKSQWETSVKTMGDFVLNHALKNEKLVVLEIGPGAGQMLKFFSDMSNITIGVELSSQMAAVAKKTSTNSILIVDNILNLEFYPGQFDIIIMGGVIHLFPSDDAENLLNKVHGWLSLNGVLFINTTIHERSFEDYALKSDYKGDQKRFRKFWTDQDFYKFISSKFNILDEMRSCEKDREKKWVAYVCKKK